MKEEVSCQDLHGGVFWALKVVQTTGQDSLSVSGLGYPRFCLKGSGCLTMEVQYPTTKVGGIKCQTP